MYAAIRFPVLLFLGLVENAKENLPNMNDTVPTENVTYR